MQKHLFLCALTGFCKERLNLTKDGVRVGYFEHENFGLRVFNQLQQQQFPKKVRIFIS